MDVAICKVEGCEKEVKIKYLQMCNAHYLKWRRYGDPTVGYQRLRKGHSRLCKLEGCNERASGQGYCAKHYQRVKKWGDPHFVSFKRTGGIHPTGKPCRWKPCEREGQIHGLCSKHYQAARYYKHFEYMIPEEARAERCMVDKCDSPRYANGLCRNHDGRAKRSGGDPHGQYNKGTLTDDGRKLCISHGCHNEVIAYGLCRLHYDLHVRNRDPEAARAKIAKAVDVLERWAMAPELWPEGKSPKDIGWLTRREAEKVEG